MSICETLQFSKRIHIGGNPQNILKISNFWQESSARKINVHHIKGIDVIDVCALCSMICYHDQTCTKKRCHEKRKKNSSMNRIVRCFHSLRWSTWNFKSTETIDGFSILEFYPSSLPPHLNPKSEWPMYNCGAGSAHHPQYGRLQIIFAARLFLNVILRFSELPTVHTSVCYKY